MQRRYDFNKIWQRDLFCVRAMLAGQMSISGLYTYSRLFVLNVYKVGLLADTELYFRLRWRPPHVPFGNNLWVFHFASGLDPDPI